MSKETDDTRRMADFTQQADIDIYGWKYAQSCIYKNAKMIERFFLLNFKK